MITLPELMYHGIMALMIIFGLYAISSQVVLKPLKKFYVFLHIAVPVAIAIVGSLWIRYWQKNKKDEPILKPFEGSLFIDDSDHIEQIEPEPNDFKSNLFISNSGLMEFFQNPLDDSDPNENSYV